MTHIDEWFSFAFGPIAWLAMPLLSATFVGFAVITVGYDYDGFITSGIPVISSFALMITLYAAANLQIVLFGFVLCYWHHPSAVCYQVI